MQTLTVIGAGTMGHGIAQVAAMAGWEVRLFDRDPAAQARALHAIGQHLDGGLARGKVDESIRARALRNLTTPTSFAQAVSGAQFVIEAVPEHLDLKQRVLSEAEALVSRDAILASNTSSIPITQIAGALTHPDRVIGTHFFNPVHVMSLLEVVYGQATSEQTLAATLAFGAEIGKTTITVRDSPGFATSRLGVALGMEAIRMVEQGVASPEDIDTAMVLGYRHPVGPLKLTDMVGLDVRLAIGEKLARELNNPSFDPPTLMREMVEAGKLGQKSGQGFYAW